MSYDRRSFLKTSVAATAGISLSGLPFVSCASGPAADNLKYGIQLYTVRNDVFKNVETTLQYLAKAGYTQIELFGFDGSKFFGKTPKELKTLFDANGLTAPSGHYYLPPVLYDGNKDLWKVTIEAAKTMGSEYMVIPWLDDKHRSAEDFKKLVGTINELAVLTKDAGMKLAYHNHEFEFGKAEDGKTFLQHLLDGTDKAMVDFELDLYWVVYSGENPLEWFKKYPGRFTMWHVKDMTTNIEGKKESTQVGDGTIDFTSIYAQSKLSGLKYGFVEQEAYTMPEEQCIKRSIEYMKKKKWGNS
ncbi:MAG: TIM barrel protein [Chitinophagaceae bacterium]|nr:TIM barrel protein [Chitinophagaceae bacterium]